MPHKHLFTSGFFDGYSSMEIVPPWMAKKRSFLS